METYKSRLQGELEGIKAGHKQALDENQIRFSHLHAERADVLKELYSRLVEMERLTNEQTAILQLSGTEQNKDFEKTRSAINSFNDYYRPNKIFFKSEECDLIGNLHKIAYDTVYAWATDQNRKNLSSTRQERLLEKLEPTEKKMRECFPVLKEKLEKEFRIEIGLENNPQIATETKQ